MIIKGFRFGILLQLAVGPMCLLVFNTSASKGLLPGFILVLSITLVDSFYILLSGFGIAAIMKKERTKRLIKLFGCIILVLFGIISESLLAIRIPPLLFLVLTVASTIYIIVISFIRVKKTNFKKRELDCSLEGISFEQINCASCGKEHDCDDLKCPNCGYR